VYHEFFRLQEVPFSLTPDPRYLWLSNTHEEGLATLYYGVTARKGFILLTGEVGSGKTTLLRAVLHKLPQETNIALVHNTADLGPMDLFKLVLRDFGISCHGETKGDYLIALNDFLLYELEQRVNVVLIVDEAQNLSRRTLEEVRLLSNLETDNEKLLQIVLTGQPELLDKLADPSMRQLRQRIAVEHHVESLSLDDVGPYLRFRVCVAGGNYDEIFEPGLEAVFYETSSGSPRVINLLADRAMLAAFSKQSAVVSRELVEKKAEELLRKRLPRRHVNEPL
jgi:general secretion pathway protein A